MYVICDTSNELHHRINKHRSDLYKLGIFFQSINISSIFRLLLVVDKTRFSLPLFMIFL